MRNIVGQPVKGEDFFKRPKLIKKILKNLAAKLSILLFAPKGAGTTSLLLYLQDEMQMGYRFVYINAGSISDIFEYYDTIYDKLEQVHVYSPHSLKRAEPASHDEIIKLLEKYSSTDLVIMIDNFFGVINNIYKEEGPKRVLNFLAIEKELRSRIESSLINVRFIYTSSNNLKTLVNELNATRSIDDLYTINIPPFSLEEAENFIKALTVDMSFVLGSEQVDYLCRKIGIRTPSDIQKVILELDNIYLDRDLSGITKQTIVEALARAFPISQEDKEVKKEFKKIKIQRIKIQHIKCFEDVEINFETAGNTTLIIGTNGKGKSTILQLIALGLSGTRFVPFPYNWKDVTRKKGGQGIFEIEALFEDKPVHFKFEIDAVDDSITCIDGWDQLRTIRDTYLLLAYGVNRSIKLEEAKQYRDIPPVATLFGENGYLKHLKVSTTYKTVEDHFGTIKPLINRVLEEANGHEKVTMVDYDADGFYFTTPSNPQERIPTEALSEGFKSTFVWLFDTMIRIVENGVNLENASDISGIILLDEVDLHLHPTWQRTILRSIETLFPNIQFIVTTHSPFVVQSAKKECLIALEMEKDSDNVVVKDKDITSELSYDAIVDEIFNIPFPFSREIERKMDEYREMEYAIRDNKDVDMKKFKELVLDIAGRGVELGDIMSRELKNLERRTGKTFDLWKK